MGQILPFCCFWKTLYKSGGIKITKWLYISYLTSGQENNGTLFSLTFKVEGNKVPLFSWLEVKWLTYSHFVFFIEDHLYECGCQTTKELYLSHLTSNQENKGTLFPSTLKVKENKVPLFSWLEVKWVRYSHFVLF